MDFLECNEVCLCGCGQEATMLVCPNSDGDGEFIPVCDNCADALFIDKAKSYCSYRLEDIETDEL